MRVTRIEIFDQLAAAEPIWRELESVDALTTPYQRFDFIAAWQRHVGTQLHWQPFIVVGYDADGKPMVLLPLVSYRRFGIGVACFPGGKHSTFNMPIWRRDFASAATAADAAHLQDLIAQQARGIDVLAFNQQPLIWAGATNPLALLPTHPSVNACPLLIMDPAAPPASRVSNSFRRRLKGKERKLEALPGYRYTIAKTETDVTRLLDGFFAIKPLRMAAQKLPDVFADPGIEDFVRAACAAGIETGRPAIEIHALECDAEMIAIFAGVADGYRFSMMFNTYTMSESAKFSPGLILMRNIIDHYAGLGFTTLDLGIGSDDYKLLFCKDDQPIFDSFLPLTARGQLAAMALATVSRTKKAVKQSPRLLHAAQAVRNLAQR